MSIVAIVEMILAIFAIAVGFFIVIGGLIVLELLYYVNGIEFAEWQEWLMVLLLPYLFFRALYFFVSRIKRAKAY